MPVINKMEAGNQDEHKTPKERKQHELSGVNLNCRFYRNQFPGKDDLVMVQVKNVSDMGAYVSLLEYNNIEGLISLGELTRKRIRSVNKLTRVGRQEVVGVLRVDETKGFIDLSKKKVLPEEIAACENKFNKGKTVHSILRHVAETTGTDIEVLYDTIAWPLYEKYEHAFDAFRVAVTDPDTVFEGLTMRDDIRTQLLHVIRSRMTPTPTKIRSDFSVTCFAYEGVDAIKAALLAGKSLSNEKFDIKIRLIAAPLYVMIMSTLDKNHGMILANECLRKIRDEIVNRGGNFVIKSQPTFIGDQGDQELEEMILKQSMSHNAAGDIEEDNDEGMDVDIGFDTAEIDKRQEEREDSYSDEEEEKE